MSKGVVRHRPGYITVLAGENNHETEEVLTLILELTDPLPRRITPRPTMLLLNVFLKGLNTL